MKKIFSTHAAVFLFINILLRNSLFSQINPELSFTQVSLLNGAPGNEFEMKIPKKEPLRFVPFYRAGDRREDPGI
jgi:hypothetical protein